jgi:hypothetical protein
VVYTSESKFKTPLEQLDLPELIDPSILRAARKIYHLHREVLADYFQRPLGIAVDRHTYRGQLIYRTKPILLPDERFVPIEQIEAEEIDE